MNQYFAPNFEKVSLKYWLFSLFSFFKNRSETTSIFEKLNFKILMKKIIVFISLFPRSGNRERNQYINLKL